MNIRHSLALASFCLLGGFSTTSQAALIDTVRNTLGQGLGATFSAGQIQISLMPNTLQVSQTSSGTEIAHSAALPTAILKNGVEFNIGQRLDVDGMSGYPQSAGLDVSLYGLKLTANANWLMPSFTVTITGRSGSNEWGGVSGSSILNDQVSYQNIQSGSLSTGSAFSLSKTYSAESPYSFYLDTLHQDIYAFANYLSSCKDPNDYTTYGFCTANVVQQGAAWVSVDKIRIEAQVATIQASVPEPEAWLLVAFGLATLAGLATRRQGQD